MRTWAFRQLRESLGQYAASIAVVAVVSAFAVLLLEVTELATTYLPRVGLDGGTARAVLTSVSITFLGIALVVAAIVIGNTFATVSAGRVRETALLRLVGAKARQVRRAALLDGLAVGVVGTVCGIAAGLLLSAVGIAVVGGMTGFALDFVWSATLVIVPSACVVVAVLAARSGARAAAAVSPAEAARAVPEGSRLSQRAVTARSTAGLVLFLFGMGIMVVALSGAFGALALLVAFPGGLLGVIGLIAGAPVIIPPVVALLTRLLPAGASAQLAGANLRLDPIRTARTVLAVTIGSMLLTMFTVAGESLRTALRSQVPQDALPEVDAFVTSLMSGAYALISCSALVAAIGLGSTLTLSVIQRRRELATLRALGFTRPQVRGMLLVESVVVTIVGVAIGLVLGVGYGYVGGHAVFGDQAGVLPSVPPVFAAVLILGALAFAAAASLAPGRRASRVPPAEALRES